MFQGGYWGKKLRTVPLTRSDGVLWPFIILLRFDKGREHLELYVPLQPTAIVLQDKIYK